MHKYLNTNCYYSPKSREHTLMTTICRFIRQAYVSQRKHATISRTKHIKHSLIYTTNAMDNKKSLFNNIQNNHP